MASLYELTDEFSVLAQQLDELDLEHEVFQDTLDSFKGPIEEKVENIAKYMKSLEALAEAKKAEAKRLTESAAKDLKKVEWFKNYMSDNLQKAGINKLQAGVFSLSFRKGSESVEVDEDKLPFDYHETKLVPMSKTQLKYFIKEEGRTIPGVQIIRKPDSLVVK